MKTYLSNKNEKLNTLQSIGLFFLIMIIITVFIIGSIKLIFYITDNNIANNTTSQKPIQTDNNMISNKDIMCASCGYVGIAPDTKDKCDICGCKWMDNKDPKCQFV